ncbi:MAG: hypothetical protein HGGPFJEG_01203 [Ignavibacteria bacterium]|nr:hypothetical protein [Ignavibacteria bacterium]
MKKLTYKEIEQEYDLLNITEKEKKDAKDILEAGIRMKGNISLRDYLLNKANKNTKVWYYRLRIIERFGGILPLERLIEVYNIE